jgi:hypothetical protein
MTHHKQKNVFVGLCMSCKKKKKLQNFSGLKICEVCQEKFDDQLIKDLEDYEYGKDIINDEKFKKRE